MGAAAFGSLAHSLFRITILSPATYGRQPSGRHCRRRHAAGEAVPVGRVGGEERRVRPPRPRHDPTALGRHHRRTAAAMGADDAARVGGVEAASERRRGVEARHMKFRVWRSEIAAASSALKPSLTRRFSRSAAISRLRACTVSKPAAVESGSHPPLGGRARRRPPRSGRPSGHPRSRPPGRPGSHRQVESRKEWMNVRHAHPSAAMNCPVKTIVQSSTGSTARVE